MKFFLIIGLLLFSGLQIFAQISAPKETVAIEQIVLMRDDGKGNPGEEISIFGAKDVPVHCRVELNSVTPAMIKMILVAVDVKGLRAEQKIVTVSYKTNGKQNIVNFTGSPDDIWAAGKYRADIFIDGKFGGGKEFEVQATQMLVPTAPKNFIAPKPVKRQPRKTKN